MSHYTDRDNTDARLRRLETRLCRLMLHLGLDPATNEPLELEQPKDHAVEVPSGMRSWPFKPFTKRA